MKRVLLVRLSAMGDVVQSLGAARALALARPDLELHFLTQRHCLPLLEGLDWLASVVPHDRSPAVRGALRTAGRLRRLKPDIALDLQGNWKSASMARLSGARLRIGPGSRSRREPGSRLLLNHMVEVTGQLHPAAVAQAVVRVLAPDVPVCLPALVAADDEIAREAAEVAALGIDPERPFRVMVWTDPGDPRSWPLEWMLLGTARADEPMLWLTGPHEAHLPAPAGTALLRHRSGEVRRLIALGHLVARAGGRVLGPDQGATHVLAACGAKTWALYGPQDPRRTAPPAAHVLCHPDPPACMPCRRRVCSHRKGPVCMAFAAEEANELRPPAWLQGVLP